MSEKLNPELRELLNTKSLTDEIPIIIIFKTKPDLNKLKLKGIKISNQFDQINGISCTAGKELIIYLSKQNDVLSIDYDGKFEALK